MILGVHLPRGNVFGLVWGLGYWGICKGVWCVCAQESVGMCCRFDDFRCSVCLLETEMVGLGWMVWVLGECGICRAVW